jgi:uncharacterized protein
MADSEDRLEAIVRSTAWLMHALVAAREVAAADWLIGAGAVRTAVWDRLHGYEQPTELADVDFAFFDPHDLSEQRETAIERQLRAVLPIEWDAKNQARVHLWYPRRFGYEVPPLSSTADAVATWPETATAVGVRLTDDDRLVVEAPLGLDDLLGMVHRRNPRRVSAEEYRRRLASKRIAERWPQVKIVPAA